MSYTPTHTVVPSIDQTVLPTDRVILVLGKTGVGKSTFIKRLTGCKIEIPSSNMSQTRTVSSYRCVYRYDGGECPMVFLDTPGFDNSEEGDVDGDGAKARTLADARNVAAIIGWLAANYSRGITIAGVLYLFRVRERRISENDIRWLTICKTLMGPEAFKRVIFVTTQWLNSGSPHYKELESNEATMFNHSALPALIGSAVAKPQRFADNPRSALDIALAIPEILSTARPLPFLIQNELIERGLALQKTGTGLIVPKLAHGMIDLCTQELSKLRIKAENLRREREGESEELGIVMAEIALLESLRATTKQNQGALAHTWGGLAKVFRRPWQLITHSK